MLKTTKNQKQSELKKLSNKQLIDRICGYSNQQVLNEDEDGQRRSFPAGQIAQRISHQGYELSDKQRYALIDQFAKRTVPETKVVGVTFRKNNAADFQKTLIHTSGVQSTYETTFRLEPEPDNPYDPQAMKVMATQTNGTSHQLGYVSREFLAQHPGLIEGQEVQGRIKDYSNGHFKNVAYSFTVDTEEMDNRAKKDEHVYTDADLQGIGDLSLDVHEMPTNLTWNASREDGDFALDVQGLGYGTTQVQLHATGKIPDAFLEDLHTLANAWGFDVPLEAATPAPVNTDIYTYSRSVSINKSIKDIAEVNEHLTSLGNPDGLASDAKNELEAYGLPDKDHLLDMGYTFETPTTGTAWIKTDAPLSTEAVVTLSSWLTYEETGGYLSNNLNALLLRQHVITNEQLLQKDVFQHGKYTVAFALTDAPATSLSLTDADLEGLNFEEGQQQ